MFVYVRGSAERRAAWEAVGAPDFKSDFPTRLLQKGFPHDILSLKTVHLDGFNIAELIQNV